MSTPSDSLSLDAARQSMDVLARHLDDFVNAWESSVAPPELQPYLPDRGEIRRLTLVELIKVDLEYRWLNRGCPKRIFDYLAEFPELAQDGVPCDLVYEEFHIRKQSGQSVTAEEYLKAFPGQTAEIASILGLGRSYESTALYHRGKHQSIEGLAAGDSIDDFDLLTELGAGAFAKVFLARQKSMQRLVALKISADQSDEPQTLAQLDHDHIVRVYDQRVLPDRKLRLLYMQYVSGGTLQSVVHRVRETAPEKRTGKLLLDAVDAVLDQRGEPRPADSPIRRWLASATWPEAVCWLGAKLARSLDYAHKRGVLHRDVKPANVLITGEPSPKLADFNISFSSKVTGATPDAFFGGSLAYMSPEQLEACDPAHGRAPEDLDGRCDFYSLGVVLWELLTGFRPFLEEDVKGGWAVTLRAMVLRREKGVHADDLANIPGCPPGLPSVMQRTLTADRDKRWSSGLEMARWLELCTNPKACALLFPAKRKSPLWLRLLTVLLVAGLLPNVVGGIFNNMHNEYEVIPRLVKLHPETHKVYERVFEITRWIVNSTAYPAGAVLFLWLGYSIFVGLGQSNRLERVGRDRLRRRSLQLGLLIAAVSIAEWSLAAFIYPISMRIFAGKMETAPKLHFFFSLILCGSVAAVYPFFGITNHSLKSLYPLYLREDLEGSAGDRELLERIGKWSRFFYLVAGATPMLAAIALTFDKLIEPDALGPQAERSLLIFLIAGVVGFVVIYFFLLPPIQANLQTLTQIHGPDEKPREIEGPA